MRRQLVTLVCSVCLCASVSLAQGEEPPAKEASKDELKAKLRKIPIGKETTFIDGPLDADGNVAYLAAMNARLRQGVTPENNAVVELWMAAGPDHWAIESVGSHEFFGEVGIRRFPSYDPFLVDWQDFALPPPVQGGEEAESQDDKENTQFAELDERRLEGTTRPWTDEEFPQLAQWLTRNEKPLAHIEKAVVRTHFYEPVCWSLTASEYGYYEVAEPTVEVALAASDLLAARAMRRIGAGNLPGAADDAIRLYQLASLVGLSPTGYAWETSSDIRFTACGVSHALADHPEATSEFLLAHLGKINKVPKSDLLIERVDYFERLICLAKIELTIRMAREDAFDEMSDRNRDFVKVLDAAFGNHLMDWSEPLRIANQFVDKSVAAMRLPTVKERHAALDKLSDQFYEFTNEETTEKPNLLLQLFQQKSIAQSLGRDVAKPLLEASFYEASGYYEWYRQDEKQLDLTKIALAVAAYQRDNGTYPLSLASLAPRYLPSVPIDADNGRPYQIRVSVVSLGVDGRDDDVSQTYDDIEIRLRELPAK